MSGKASGCWLDTVTPKLLPVVCGTQRSLLPPVVFPAEHTAWEDNSEHLFRRCNMCFFFQCCLKTTTT